MRIIDMSINGANGIQRLNLELGKGINLICGNNGIGKTTIINCIASSFSFSMLDVSRNVRMPNNLACSINLILNINGSTIELPTEITDNGEPALNKNYAFIEDHVGEVIHLRNRREIPQGASNQLGGDEKYTGNWMMNQMGNDIQPERLKVWFTTRSYHAESRNTRSRLTSAQQENYSSAIQAFSLIDSAASYSHIDSSTRHIMVQTKTGVVPFDSLSSGYIAAIYLLWGILRAIETRISKDDTPARHFGGIILIDEIELHLHPKWQASLLRALRQMVPSAQIVATTHSPHMIQCAEPSEVIALDIDSDGNVYQRDLPSSEYGYKGWTLEEILTDVMGMELTRSQEYCEAEASFHAALQSGDSVALKTAYETLVCMLHPQSPVKEILAFQMIGAGIEP